MTREYAARQLLAHGALTRGEFIAITGWGACAANHALERLLRKGIVLQAISDGYPHYLYELAE